MIDFDKITFSNNYMFNTVMTRKELCRKCLERILGKNITDISIPDSEKWIGPSIAAKSIRLDIYCEDEDTMYNIELQNGASPNLPKRSRYYQSLMDIDDLGEGEDYLQLRNSIVIFICTFDPYEMDRHIYTFENRCIQDDTIKLEDGTTKIFLNTKGIMNDVPLPLKLFLDYIDNGTVTDELTKQINDAVIDIRKDKRWRKRIMTLDQYAKEQAELKKDDWIAEGVKQGIEQGQALATDRMNILISKLLEANRTDELAASSKDPELQKKLFEEFGLL